MAAIADAAMLSVKLGQGREAEMYPWGSEDRAAITDRKELSIRLRQATNVALGPWLT
jgi:hypothetical protein